VIPPVNPIRLTIPLRYCGFLFSDSGQSDDFNMMFLFDPNTEEFVGYGHKPIDLTSGCLRFKHPAMAGEMSLTRFRNLVPLARRFKPVYPNAASSDVLTPPVNAEFLFYLFMDAKNCDALVGDLQERYRLIHKTFGASKANFWYWRQAIQSVSPIVRAWGKKIVMKPAVGIITWAAAKHLLSDGSWLATVAEFVKAKIRL
jgi:hypothetical protein